MKSACLSLVLFSLALNTGIAPGRAQTPIISESSPGGKPATPRRVRPRPKPTPASAVPAASAAAWSAPKLLWKTFLRRCDATAVGVGSVVYTTANTYLYQLDEGRTLWATEMGATQATPFLDDTRVYVGSDRGAFYGFNRKTGQILWKFTGAANSILTAPTVGAGRVYFESTDNAVYAVAASTGNQIWKFVRPDGSLGYSGPVFSEDAVYVGGETTLYRIDAETGKEMWHTLIGGKSLSAPTVGNGKVYVGGDGSGLTALDQTGGETAWKFTGKVAADWFGPPLLADKTVYVSTYSRYVYALDAETGKQKWSYRLLGNALARPTLDAKRGVLYVSSATFRDNPTLTALDAKTGAKLWDYKMGYVNGSPLVLEDRLYVGSTNGYFYAFALR